MATLARKQEMRKWLRLQQQAGRERNVPAGEAGPALGGAGCERRDETEAGKADVWEGKARERQAGNRAGKRGRIVETSRQTGGAGPDGRQAKLQQSETMGRPREGALARRPARGREAGWGKDTGQAQADSRPLM
ncbi:hypothetical protein NDU88_000772 [Pleurodeles waltl]|uniref:Uncharacterized protein n=1 Tax=Pleurodeles waltl TaxID=8319 RepID=A0AAV7SXD5_PLEWA|nr:hypothetical protein NDU88_000772 [Pleurodeles waltl]